MLNWKGHLLGEISDSANLWGSTESPESNLDVDLISGTFVNFEII